MYPAPGVQLKDFNTKWFSITMTFSCLWSFNGGWINAVALAGIWNAGLTHLTGSTSISAIRFINPAKPGQYSQFDLLSFIFFWFLGSFVVGLIMGAPKLRWGRLQGSLIVLHGASLIIAWRLAPSPDLKTTLPGVMGGCFVSFAMGIQNALTSNFQPGVLRTSHHSGTVLDVGLAIGQCVHSRSLDNLWKVKVFTINYVGFWIGALLGCVAWNNLSSAELLIQGCITLFVDIV
eukprot:TRINITY_DN27894_c0_g1_i1.p1 TRINITY_DN27894_c0_g1~~TRINITY_DN27894_c0_g1_i1.p1  ORF type:complete len:233 (-),score=24.16 TRINITY_DN27894_c0_g1_i1:190-888(-)